MASEFIFPTANDTVSSEVIDFTSGNIINYLRSTHSYFLANKNHIIWVASVRYRKIIVSNTNKNGQLIGHAISR